MKPVIGSLLLVLLVDAAALPARAAEATESLRKKASAVLAQLEGEIKVPGSKEPVEVLRDRWGIPHIYATNADDLFFAQGKVVRETVAVRGEDRPAKLELRFTRHGPVIAEDAKRRRAYVLKWTGSEPGGAAYLASLALDRVKNGREFVAALKRWKAPSENMVYADMEGNIGWVAAALTPVRKGWDGLLPVPGAKDSYEWQGFLPLKDLPQAHNPHMR